MANSPRSPWKLSGGVAKLAAGNFSAAVTVDRPGLGIHEIAWAGQPLGVIRNWLAFKEVGPGPADRQREIEDVYVRGRDLVAVYAESKQHPLRYVVYWRSLGEADLCGAAGGLDVVVSVQTSVLDAKPAVFLSSQYGVERGWTNTPPQRRWNPIAFETRTDRPDREHLVASGLERNAQAVASPDDTFLFDLAQAPWSCGEMIHPSDRIASDANVIDFPGVPPLGADSTQWDPETENLRVAMSSHHVLGVQLEKGVLVRARLRGVLARREGAREVVAACRNAFEQAELPLTT